MSDGDEIRRRRIERLAMLERAQSAALREPAQQGATPGQASEQRKPVTSPGAGYTPSPGESSKPSPSTSLRASPSGSASSLADSSKGADAVKSKPPPKRVSRAAPAIPTVSYVFGTPESDQQWQDVADSVDAIIWDQMVGAKRAHSGNPIDYLISVYNRSEKLSRDLPDIAKQIQDTVITMTYISATADDDDEVHGVLGAALLDAAGTAALSSSFVQRFLAVASEDSESFPLFLHNLTRSLLEGLHFGVRNTPAYFHVVEGILDAPGVPEILLQLPAPQEEGKPLRPGQIARQTLLGLALGSGITDMGLVQQQSDDIIINSSVSELVELAKRSDPVTGLLDDLQFKFVEKLIRKGPATRRLVLDWFVVVLNANHGQTAMNRIPGKTNSLQLMVNAFKVLLRLAEPFVKLNPSVLVQQLSKINPSYFANKNSHDVSDETKVLASQDAPFNSRDKEDSLNFVTECFFLCAGFLHFGYHATVQAIGGSLKRQVEHFQSQLATINNDPNLQNMAPAMKALTLGRFSELLKAFKCELAGLTATLHNSEFMGRVLRFSELTLAFDVYAAENCPSTGLEIRVPWDVDPPSSYASFPEYLVEAPSVAASFILRSAEFFRDTSMSMNNQLLIDASIFYMSSPKVLRNPYLRSKFVEILYFGGADVPLTSGTSIPGTFSPLFTSSDTCRKFLVPALMSVFIDIEHTGRTSQFYEKFTTREFVANVFKVLWRDPHYRNQLVSESEIQPEFFVKFVALLLNDATFLLDEALSKLLEVHKLQHDSAPDIPTTEGSAERARPSAGADEPETDGEQNNAQEDGDEDEMSEGHDPASRLRSAERQAQNFLHLSTSTMMLLNTFTGTVPQIFATPEIIDRFSVMLNYNLAALVGPRCNHLKVKNPAELGFNPRQLLSDLVRVYLNLRNEPPFAKSLSKDERSYRDENFTKAYKLLSKFSLLSPIDLDNFADLAKRTREAWQETQEEEEEFGDDIPDEYLDPLMFELMNNPVTLPTSKVNIDLSTIKTHLLSDPIDPFNRVPLKIEDVIPNHELKAEIEEFKRRKKEERRQQKQ